MMKYLREHNRKILAIVTAFVLVSWLVGAPLRDLLSPNPAKARVGAAFGKSITSGDLYPTKESTDILGALGIPWRTLGSGLSETPELLKPEHWYLLVQEANRAGIDVPDLDVDDFLSPQRFPPQLIDNIRRNDHVSPEQIRHAVREFLMVDQYARNACDVYEPSDNEIRHFVRDTQEKVSVRTVVFRARDFLDPGEQLQPAEITELYEQHRDKLPADSDDGLGYRFPRRVRVQYLGARLADVMPTIALNEDEVRRTYRKSRASPDFMEPTLEDDPAATQPTTSGPTTGPASQPVVRKILVYRPMSYEKARPKIEESIRRRTAVNRVRETMQRVAADLSRPWLAVSVGQDGYKPTPDEVRNPAYLSAAKERLEKQYGIPLVYKETDLVTDSDAANVEGIGKAVTIGEGKDRLTFGDYAFRLPGLFDAKGAGETALRLALFQTTDNPIYTEVGGQPEDYYVFRVVELQEPRAAGGIDEVRAQVERDLREKRAYARAEKRAKEFYAVARRVGIEAAYQAATDLHDAKYQNAFAPKLTPQFSRREPMFRSAADRAAFVKTAIDGGSIFEPPLIPELGARSAEFVDRCFDMTSPLWTPPTVDVSDPNPPPTTASADGKPVAVNFIPLPKLRLAVVVGLADTNIIRDDAFRNQYYNVGRQTLMSFRRALLQTQWFNPNDIERRCGFVREKTEDGEHVPITHERNTPTPPEF